MQDLLDITKVQTFSDFQLEVEFENGERRKFDMKPWLNKKPFTKLKDLPLFCMAKVEHGTVVWPGNIDIAPETIYLRSSPIQ